MAYRFLGTSKILRLVSIYDITINRFMTIQEIQDRYGEPVNYLRYYSLISAIPNSWKFMLKNRPLHRFWIDSKPYR